MYKTYLDRLDSLEGELTKAIDGLHILMGSLTSKYRKLGDIDTLVDIELLNRSFNHLLTISFAAHELLKSFNKRVLEQINDIKEVKND
jgi:hypothetical protein